MNRLISGLLLIVLLTGCKMKEQAHLIIINANVYTVDSAFSKCTAIAVRDGIIIDTGDDDSILDRYRSGEILDLKGRALYPGFNDAHCHLFGMGLGLSRVDLRGAKSFDEILRRLSKKQEESKPKYLAGDGWDQNLWEVKEFPDNKQLNALFPDIPVVLSRVDFHAVIVNDAAIKALGITPGDDSYPKGEAVVKDGRFTGLFLEGTADRFKTVLPEPDREEAESVLLAAQQECFRYGLTSLSHGGESLGIIEIMDDMYSDNRLKIRTDVWLTPDESNLKRFTSPYINSRMRISAIKIYVDGALGSRGALMLEPYSDMPLVKGLKVITTEEFKRLCEWAYNHGFQVATHCIGDAANREALNVYSEFLREGNDLRWRIEHSQVVHPDDFELFGKYSIVPSIQPTHATSDMLWADERLGERIEYAYAYKRLLDQLGWIPSGTDFPIEEVNPIYTFYAAHFRKNPLSVSGPVFEPENSLTREEALRSMTIWAAKATLKRIRRGVSRGANMQTSRCLTQIL